MNDSGDTKDFSGRIYRESNETRDERSITSANSQHTHNIINSAKILTTPIKSLRNIIASNILHSAPRSAPSSSSRAKKKNKGSSSPHSAVLEPKKSFGTEESNSILFESLDNEIKMKRTHQYLTLDNTKGETETNRNCRSSFVSNLNVAASSKIIIQPPGTQNILDWITEIAPIDIMPRILSFCGSRKIDLLSKSCKKWRDISRSEHLWRTLSEDTHKWKEGNVIPESWLQLYKESPCVPIDYSTIEGAFAASSKIAMGSKTDDEEHPIEQNRRMRLLVHPGKYVVREPLVINAIGSHEVSIEALSIPVIEGKNSSYTYGAGIAHRSPSKKHRFSRRLKGFLNCRSSTGVVKCQNSQACHSTSEMNSNAVDDFGLGDLSLQPERYMRRVLIVLKTDRQNEPIIRVQQGTFKLKNVDLIHNCSGTDIWNGNSAIQVQPPLDPDGEPIANFQPSIPPTAILDKVDIKSVSGRGIVAIDGGIALINHCHIHHCAATGIYVGGPGSIATIKHSDVIHNGDGNPSNRRGIARGHSGIYLEQGQATIEDSNVSHNSLTGVSAVSTDNATLQVECTDLVANGTLQIEMPPAGSLSRVRSFCRNNLISKEGMGRTRSGIILEEDSDGRTEFTSIRDSSPSPNESSAMN